VSGGAGAADEEAADGGDVASMRRCVLASRPPQAASGGKLRSRQGRLRLLLPRSCRERVQSAAREMSVRRAGVRRCARAACAEMVRRGEKG
jgi:hypothetical protein